MFLCVMLIKKKLDFRTLCFLASSTNLPKLQVSNEYQQFLAVLKVLINSRKHNSDLPGRGHEDHKFF